MSSSPEWLGGRIQYKELHALPSSPAVEGVQDLGRPPLHRGAGRQPPSPVVDVLLRPGGRRAISWLAVLVQKALLDHQLLLTRLEDGQGVQVTTVSMQSRSHNHTHTEYSELTLSSTGADMGLSKGLLYSWEPLWSHLYPCHSSGPRCFPPHFISIYHTIYFHWHGSSRDPLPQLPDQAKALMVDSRCQGPCHTPSQGPQLC